MATKYDLYIARKKKKLYMLERACRVQIFKIGYNFNHT